MPAEMSDGIDLYNDKTESLSSIFETVTSYQENRESLKWNKKRKEETLRKIENAIIRKAHSIIKNVKPHSTEYFDDWNPLSGEEIDFEHSLEFFSESNTDENLDMSWLKVKRKKPKRVPLCLMIDTSLSMTGEKLFQTGVALALNVLLWKQEDLSILVFGSRVVFLKHFSEVNSLRGLIRKFLEFDGFGYTNIEKALKEGLGELSVSPTSNTCAMILTDGKYTAGKNPVYLAKDFKRLNVIRIGDDPDFRDICRKLAIKGHGLFIESTAPVNLPYAMYNMVRKTR